MALTVREMVLRTPVTALPETPIWQAEQQLIERNVREIYLVDEQERLLGLVPEVELLTYRLLGGDGMGRIASLMGEAQDTLAAQETLDQAAVAFRNPQCSSLAVLQGERLIGILMRSDFLRRLIDHGQSLPGSFTVPPPKFSQFTQSGELIHRFDREFALGQ